MAVRSGLNGTLAYLAGGSWQRFDVRVTTVTHTLVPVFRESTGRSVRAMYPHRMSSGQFTLGLVVVGQAERRALTAYLGAYAAALLDPGSAGGILTGMDVTVPSRGFARIGVPLTGLEWGMRVGQGWFTPQVTFETAYEPLDLESVAVASAVPSVAAVGDGAVQYFYPFGTQLSADPAPAVAPAAPHRVDWGF